MRRAVAVASFAIAMAVLASPAAAGGGCHRAGDGSTEGTGDTVAFSMNCMTPTVLRVEPGATVTFVNQDEVQHNVFGLGWGDDVVTTGERVERRFASAGVYPYACSLHPGMVGAVVVGDGHGAGVVEEVAAETAAVTLPAAAPAAATDDTDDSSAAAPLAIGAAAVALAAGLAYRAGRRGAGIGRV
jgi:plastocyanin